MGRPGLTKHRKFIRLERMLGSHLVARGVLETLWDGCYENGDEYLGESIDIEGMAHWDGREGALTEALLSSGFIEPIEGQPGHFQVHDLWHHAPDYVQKRRRREVARRSKSDPCAVTFTENPVSVRSVSGHGPVTVRHTRAQSGVTPAPAPAPCTPTPPKGGRRGRQAIPDPEAQLQQEDLRWFEQAREEYPKEAPDGKPVHMGTRMEGLQLWAHLLATLPGLTGRVLRGCQALMLQAQEENSQRWRYAWPTVFGPKKAPWRDFEAQARRLVAEAEARERSRDGPPGTQSRVEPTPLPIGAVS